MIAYKYDFGATMVRVNKCERCHRPSYMALISRQLVFTCEECNYINTYFCHIVVTLRVQSNK